jgi:general transcription factor 3C polypeptide 3 (transcription factor C subunit 4)
VATVMNLATCHQFGGNLAEAEEMYSLGRTLLLQFSCKVDSITVLGSDPENRDAKLKLAEVYEALNEPKKALALVYEGMLNRDSSTSSLIPDIVIDARKKQKEGPSNTAANGTPVEESSLITAPKSSKREKRPTVKQSDAPRRPTRLEVQAREKEKTTEMLQMFATLNETTSTLGQQDESAIQAWMALALTLVDDFREAKELFPASRVNSFFFAYTNR